MNRNSQAKMALDFPLETFLQVKQVMLSARTALQREKAAWSVIRESRQVEELALLDQQFKAEFEKLSASSPDFPAILQSLRELVQRGASASLLGNHELGSYNLAMLIAGIPLIHNSASLEIIPEITRITLVAGADINAQKAYAGNGGANSLEWLCWYLAGGVPNTGLGRLRDLNQYQCCYSLFPWLVEKETPLPVGLYRPSPFTEFLVGLRHSPATIAWQEKILLAMMGLGFSPFSTEQAYPFPSFFKPLATINVKWLGLLFPFEGEGLADYLRVLKPNITGAVIKQLMKAFTSNNQARRYFRAFFSHGPHWLLQLILESVPQEVFSLVKRNEKDLLIPFLEHFQSAVVDLRDENGNTLLHQAILCRGLAGKTVQLLLKARLSPHLMNKEGITPLALALKHNRTALLKLLQ